jgi:hypothetical protein
MTSRRSLGGLRTSACCGSGVAGHFIDAARVSSFRCQGELEFLPNDTRKEAADRVRLPAGRLHYGFDRRARGLRRRTWYLELTATIPCRSDGIRAGWGQDRRRS